jgi:hypothetical protein
MSIVVVCIATPYSLVGRYRFGGTYRLYLQGEVIQGRDVRCVYRWRTAGGIEEKREGEGGGIEAMNIAIPTNALSRDYVFFFFSFPFHHSLLLLPSPVVRHSVSLTNRPLLGPTQVLHCS